MKLIGMCGALRAGSFNRKLMHDAAARFGAADFTDANLRIPLYDGDEEAANGIPSPVQTLADQIAGADAVIVACPEYNQSLTGVMKNALDWVSRVDGSPWRDKPVALMSAAAGRAGGARANYALRLAMAPFRPVVVNGPEILVAGAAREFDDTGKLTNARYTDALDELMALLRGEAERRRAS
ncbi:MAG: NADPH-dependent FMN reductase [Pseudomonadota bacterium]